MLSYFDFSIDFQVLFQNKKVLVTYILKMMTEKYMIRSFALGSVTNKGICQTCSVCLSKSVFNSSLPCSGKLGFSNSSPRALFPWGHGWLLAMGHSNRALKGSEETGIFLSQLPHYSLPVLLFSQDCSCRRHPSTVIQLW